ncbi:efflux RND transporter periplasmic adaptor subunit [Candidatus Desulforudis audaxviator]|uniref:Efflux transporter, RND family, MFP subunit n=1 Tax=Desulforudis audaxviator (strain MP104C) TaxID=477974 RepID=B1I443_DESAP|nr:efflux RND transporter periplasmic adaptor subunit [Candidatus Desulforudis audaxviator]ACA59658.1 efflux transporter, RND family, MFP subunit [Candidatus Desulforudis audaxviator MP104C]AZK59649.1 putative RND efflux membrane fusion protein [Candidatus Desulforudis audaxviator]
MLSRKIKVGLGIVIVGLLAGGGYLVSALQPVAVRTAAAVATDLTVTVRGTGDVEAAAPDRVYAEAGGKLVAVPVAAGDRVAPGDLLAVFDTAALQDRLALAAAERRTLEAQQAELAEQNRVALELAALELEQAGTNLERAEFLHAQQVIPDAELEAARRAREAAALNLARAEAGKLALDTVAARLDAARTAERQAERQLRQARVTAASAGVILERMVEPGAVVAPGAPLFVVGDPEILRVVAEIEPRDAGLVAAGQTVRIRHLAGGAPVASGRVTRVVPSGTVTVSALGVKESKARVEIEVVEGARELKPGFQVNVEIIVDEAPGETVVPETALFRQDGATFLFVVRDGRAVKTAVTPGRRAAELTEVTGDLKTGESVIVHPGAEVKDGVRVQAR